ncbi:TPA: hypothetical protein TZW92_001839 [Streptococcus suis]|nr:hypothetical protein [Streptococcus suis]
MANKTKTTSKIDDNILYTGRLYLFGVIPLWKVNYTKQDWKRRMLWDYKRNKLFQIQFIEPSGDKEVY